MLSVLRRSQNQMPLLVASWRRNGRPFDENLHVFTDPVAAVLEDVSRVRDAPHLVHRDKVRGFMYDLAASKLAEVGPDAAP